MWKLLDLFNTSDAKCILINEDDADNSSINANELVEASEVLIQEWEKLRGSTDYENHLRDKEFYLYKVCEMHALNTIVTCLTYNFKYLAKQLIDEFKFKIKPELKDAVRKRKLLSNWFKLNGTKHDEEENEQIIWEDLKAYAEYTLGYQIDYNCTATQYIAYEKIIKRIQASKNKTAHGKED